MGDDRRTDASFLSCLSSSAGLLFGVLELAVMPDREEAGIATGRFVALAAEGMGFHLGHRFGEVVGLLQGVAYCLRVVTDLVGRPQHQAHSVVGLRGSERVEIAALILEYAVDFLVQGLGIRTVV